MGRSKCIWNWVKSVDVLVNNAGSAEISAFEDYPSAGDFRKSVVNFSCLFDIESTP